ncbi:hypothetical protein NEAUS03_0712 [Nematocida ausubeli]|nr:hypothetical protein NEAUS03_0712 [Nematocida ausubeli]
MGMEGVLKKLAAITKVASIAVVVFGICFDTCKATSVSIVKEDPLEKSESSMPNPCMESAWDGNIEGKEHFVSKEEKKNSTKGIPATEADAKAGRDAGDEKAICVTIEGILIKSDDVCNDASALHTADVSHECRQFFSITAEESVKIVKCDEIRDVQSLIADYYRQSGPLVAEGIYPEYDRQIKKINALTLEIKILRKAVEEAESESIEQGAKTELAEKTRERTKKEYVEYMEQMCKFQWKYCILIEKEIAFFNAIACRENLLCEVKKKEIEHMQTTGEDDVLLKKLLHAHEEHKKYFSSALDVINCTYTRQKSRVSSIEDSVHAYIEYCIPKDDYGVYAKAVMNSIQMLRNSKRVLNNIHELTRSLCRRG